MKAFKHKFLLGALLFVFNNAFSQNIPPTSTVKLFFEKCFLHTDRATYAPGEDLWFKAYVVNARDNRLIGTSKNLYIELITPADTIAAKEIVHLDNGVAKGDIILANKLPSGTYRLRAYTNWMRNFDDKFIFEKSIIITASSIPGRTTVVAKSSVPTNQQSTKTAVAAVASLRFYPEGGSLVNGISAIVAVKAEDAMGNGIAASGPVISAAGDTVAKFKCDSLGMGTLALLPFPAQTYRGFINFKGQKTEAPLPPALASGMAIKVTKRDTVITVTISTNNPIADKIAYLSASHTGATVIDQQIKLVGNQVSVKIPESILPEGVVAFTLSDDQHKPDCERLIYVEHKNEASKLVISLNKPTYKPRERVNVAIKIADVNNKPLAGNLSMGVIDAQLNRVNDGDILSYLMLESEIKGKIEHAERYFDTTNANRTAQLDVLLLTQGWRDFIWKRLAEAPINIAYLPEQGFTLNGRVKKESNNSPIAGANITLSAPKASGQKLFFTKTDANGNYYFDNLQLFGEQNIRVSTRNLKGEANGVIELDSLSKRLLTVKKSIVKTTIEPNPETAAEIIKRASFTKGLDSVTNLNEVKIKGSRKIVLRDQIAVTNGYPDEVLVPKGEDLKFANLRAYILYASNQAKPDASGENIVFYAQGKTYKPRIIVDNSEVPFTEEDDADILEHYYNSYFNLPMNVIDKVVIKRLLGGLKPPAIGSSETANAMGNTVAGARAMPPQDLFLIYLSLKPGALQKNYGGITTANIQGYYESREFYKPIHNSTGFDSPKPDMRNTIHWEPIIKTDANGEATVSFYNADLKTSIRVIVQGITENGKPVSVVKTYDVR